jgi:ferrous iron transport protein A
MSQAPTPPSPPTTPPAQPLTSLPIGAKGRVAELRIPAQDKPRLMEMGLLVGTPVELIRFAPLGDPVEIKVRGYHLTLRRHEAEQILVRPS